MAMATAKNMYTTMRDVELWLRSLNISCIHYHIDPLSDDIQLVNTVTYDKVKITRYELEDAKDYRTPLVEAISKLMAVDVKEFGKMLSDALTRGAISQVPNTYVSNNTGATYVPPPISANGAIGSVLRGASGTSMWDDQDAFTKDIENKLLAKRLFSKEETDRLIEIKKWIKSATAQSQNVFHSLMHNTSFVVAGGCFASLINEEPVHDIDFFILNDEYLKDIVKKIIDRSAGDDRVRVGNSDYMNNDQIENTIFFKDSKFQFITTKFKSREELVKHFDFKHCCVSYSFSTDTLHISRETYDLIKAKKLVPQNVNKLPAQWRYEKFLNRGWTKPEITIDDDFDDLVAAPVTTKRSPIPLISLNPFSLFS